MSPKTADLSAYLKALKKVVVAYSGGVDSTFLLYCAKKALGPDNVLAIIARSPTYPKEEVESAKKMSKKIGVKYRVINTDEFSDNRFISNPTERCYYCKSELFSKLAQIAKKQNITYVLDGSNYDDISDFRPGSRAKKEYGVKSPLQELKFTKDDIRRFSKKFKLPTWDKPSYACLASRIPYRTRITEGILGKVGDGEGFLRKLGFKQVRVRHHGDIVRLELDPVSNKRLLKESGLSKKVENKFRKIGYTYITLDLSGYRTGSMNEVLLRNKK